MNEAAKRQYVERIRRVIEYIQQHLDQPLSLEQLSDVAHFSKFHFQRQFAALVGISASQLLQVLRLKRAAYQLAYRDQRVIDVALQAGFENPESFSRAFKKAFGQTSSAFKKQPRLSWQDDFNLNAVIGDEPMAVEIVDLEAIKVAVLEHRGDPGRLGETLQRFIAWRKANKLSPNISRTFNLIYDDPNATAPEAFRLDLCAQVPREFESDDVAIVMKTIPAGRCAWLRHLGSWDGLEQSARYLYGEWLPISGEELRDFPLFIERVNLFPDVAEHELISDIYLPLK